MLGMTKSVLCIFLLIQVCFGSTGFLRCVTEDSCSALYFSNQRSVVNSEDGCNTTTILAGLVRSSSGEYFSITTTSLMDDAGLSLVYAVWNTGVMRNVVIPSNYSIVILEYENATGLVHLVGWQTTSPTPKLYLLSINPRIQSQSWTIAPIAYPLPQGSQIQYGVSAIQSNSIYLLITLDGVTWNLASISTTSRVLSIVPLSDDAFPSSETWNLQILNANQLIATSSIGGVEINLSTAPAQVLAVDTLDDHLTKAQIALGCSGLSMQIFQSNAVTDGTFNYFYWAIPSRLSAIIDPFWYILSLDSNMSSVQFQLVDQPSAALLDNLPKPTITSFYPSFYIPGTRTNVSFTGKDFDERVQLDCFINSANISLPIQYVNSTFITCSIPPLSLQPTFTGSLRAWNTYSLFEFQLASANATTPNTTVNITATSKQSLNRLLLAYKTGISLPKNTQTPLQDSSRLLRGMTFITKELKSPQSKKRQDIIQEASNFLMDVNWPYSIGIPDCYDHYSNSASDFQQIAQQAASNLILRGESMPAIFDQAASFSLDNMGLLGQSWLESNIATADSLGALPSLSSSFIQQITSLTVNSALQAADDIPVIQAAFQDSVIQGSLGFDYNFDTQTLVSALPPGPITQIFTQVLNSDSFTIPSTLPIIDSIQTGLLDGLSSFADSVEAISSSPLDEFSIEEFDSTAGVIQGIGSVGAFVANNIFHDAKAAQTISTVSQVAGVVATGIIGFATGGVVPALGALVGGLGSLFGGGDDEMKQEMLQQFNVVNGKLDQLRHEVLDVGQALSNQLTKVETHLYQEISSGFTGLSNQVAGGFNVTLRAITSLQSQMLAENMQLSKGIVSIMDSVRYNTFQITAVQQQLSSLQQQISQLQNQIFIESFAQDAGHFDIAKSNLDTVLSQMIPGDNSQRTKILNPSDLPLYKQYMTDMCNCRLYAAYPSQNGYEPNVGLTGIGSTIRSRIHYDLVFGLLPDLLATTLKNPLPNSYYTYSDVPQLLSNPIQWAKVVNAWLEARIIVNTAASDSVCASALWHEGLRLQIAVRQAVSYSTFQSLLNQTQKVVATAKSTFAQEIASDSPDKWLDTPTYQSFDDICSVASLLVTLGQATGLGSNKFISGYVPGAELSTLSLSGLQYLTTPQRASQIFSFSTLSSISSIKNALFTILNNSSVNISDPANQQDIQDTFATILESSLASLSNTIDTFYPPCEDISEIMPSLSFLDTTMRRLAGFMMQSNIQFQYVGKTVNFPVPKAFQNSTSSTGSNTAVTTSAITSTSTSAATSSTGAINTNVPSTSTSTSTTELEVSSSVKSDVSQVVWVIGALITFIVS